MASKLHLREIADEYRVENAKLRVRTLDDAAIIRTLNERIAILETEISDGMHAGLLAANRELRSKLADAMVGKGVDDGKS